MSETNDAKVIRINEIDKDGRCKQELSSESVDPAVVVQKPRQRQPIKLRRTYLDMINDEEEDDGGDGDRGLKPDPEIELQQRVERRSGETLYGRHVRDARDPLFNNDQEMGMGPGLQAHPLLMDIPVGAEAPIEQINAMENNAAKQELQMKLENKKRMQYSSAPTPAPSR